MYAEVIIDISNKNVDRVFSYKIPEELKDKVFKGYRVQVPFGVRNALREGIVIGFCDKVDFPENRLKSISSVIDNFPVIDEKRISLAKWMKEKYYTTLSDCLQCIIPKVVNDKTRRYAYINFDRSDINELIYDCLKKNNQQSRVIRLLKEKKEMFVDEIKLALGIADSPIKTLEKNGLIKISQKEIKRDVFNAEDYKKTYNLNPTEEQKNAIDFLKNALDKIEKKPVLIHGVTGSGKTEIFLQLIDEAINRGKQAIVLVPEISLTPQTVQRFIERFGTKVSVTHSKLSDGERFDQWKKAREGEISVMIGPRSAIFTPFENLGVIIIDEEHENSYKSETTPKYDTKEVAEKLGALTGALTVLASATPSVDSYYKATNGRYDLIKLVKRVNNSFPEIEIVDMRVELEEGNRSIFSRKLFSAMKRNIDEKKQTILFLNRRGHSTFVSCRKCGYVMTCENCNVNYTYHLDTNKLTCHYCNTTVESPKLCPQCGMPYIRHFGVGTQKIEEEVKKYLPNARVLRMDLDTTSRKNSHQSILKSFAEGKADILIGTQMIAKGLDFPNVTLVGVVAADTGLNSGDYRCGETSFQLLTQVAGRAGRADQKGLVYIQSYQTEHYSLIYTRDNNYEGFFEHEIEQRRQMVYPPFSHIFFVLFTGEDEKKVISKIYALAEIMKIYNKRAGFDILGPAPAAISKIKKQFRYKIIIKGIEEERVKAFVLYCVDKLRENEDLKGVNINLTLDPSFLQ